MNRGEKSILGNETEWERSHLLCVCVCSLQEGENEDWTLG